MSTRRAENIKVLIHARKLITDPAHWTQGYAVRDAEGNSDVPIDKAVCFCAIGACMRAEHDLKTAYAASSDPLYDTLHELGIKYGLADYNDSHTHEEVLALFDKTINRLKEAP